VARDAAGGVGGVEDAPMKATIRRIRQDEGLRLRRLRRAALADAPMAFSSTLEGEEAFPEHLWHERAQRGDRRIDCWTTATSSRSRNSS